MPTRISMEFLGTNEFEAKLEALGRKGSQIENQALLKAAEPIREDAYNRAPRRRKINGGREFITISKVKTIKGKYKAVDIGIMGEDRPKGFHMYYQEFGTSQMAANPFLAPAYESKKAEAMQIIKDELKKGLGL